MRRKIRGNLTYANVVSTLALIVAVGGGAAYAANTVFSSDIVDGQVRNPDIGTNAVRTGKILNENLTGDDVANGSLTGADLGVMVKSGRQTVGACGTVVAYSDCVSVPFTITRPQRLLLIASGEWSAGAGGAGECIMEVDDNGTFLGVRSFGEASTATVPSGFAMNATTGIVPAGSHYVDVSCHEISDNTTIVRDVDLSVVAIGDG